METQEWIVVQSLFYRENILQWKVQKLKIKILRNGNSSRKVCFGISNYNAPV